MQIVHFKEIDSTNVEAQKNIYKHKDVVVADFQTNGRGQRGNVWSSQREANLTFSAVLELGVSVYEQFYVSMLAAVAVQKTLALYGLDAKIKWSNDIYIGDKKIAGILIEHHSMGETVAKSVVGIGINVGQTQFDANIPNPTSCALHGLSVSKDQLLNRVCITLEELLTLPKDQIYRDFMSELWRSDGYYKYFDVEKADYFMASIENVEPSTGELTLKTETGAFKKFWFKQVEFVL